jgi:hypothetical protein
MPDLNGNALAGPSFSWESLANLWAAAFVSDYFSASRNPTRALAAEVHLAAPVDTLRRSSAMIQHRKKFASE